MLISISQHYFKNNNSAYYANFKSISNYQGSITIDENEKFVESRLLHDLDFVLKNRDLDFFIHVMDSYFPYYSELSFIDLIIEIAGFKTDFKPYIDYLDKPHFRTILMNEIYDVNKPDLLSCLFIKGRNDIADYLVKEKNYPAIFVDKMYNFPYPAQAVRRDHINNIKNIITNYNVNMKELTTYLITPTKDFSKRIQNIDLFIRHGFIEDTQKFHTEFLFNNSNALFSIEQIKSYCEHFKLVINTPECKKMAEESFQNIRPFLHSKQTIKWLLTNNIDIKKVVYENMVDTASFFILQFDNNRFAFINYCKDNHIQINSNWLHVLIQHIYSNYSREIPENKFSHICNTLLVNGLDISEYNSHKFVDVPEMHEYQGFITDIQVKFNRNKLSNVIHSNQKSIIKRI